MTDELQTVARQWRWGGDERWRQFGPIFDDEPREVRELVTRSQAEVIIAAKDTEISELKEDRKQADLALVDKYRDPKYGHFVFPDDVAAIIRKLDASEADNAALTARVKELSEINANLMGDDEDKPRYTTKRLKQEVERVTQVMRGEASDREAHAKALETQLAAARKALEPFAAVLNDYDPEDEDDFTPGTLVIGSVTNYEITLGDLRDARAALEAKP